MTNSNDIKQLETQIQNIHDLLDKLPQDFLTVSEFKLQKTVMKNIREAYKVLHEMEGLLS